MKSNMTNIIYGPYSLLISTLIYTYFNSKITNLKFMIDLAQIMS